MNCPKCGNEMLVGAIGVDALSKGYRAKMFWAPSEVFGRHMAQLLTTKKAVSEGGVKISIGNGLTKNRTPGYACKDCNYVLLDLNQT